MNFGVKKNWGSEKYPPYFNILICKKRIRSAVGLRSFLDHDRNTIVDYENFAKIQRSQFIVLILKKINDKYYLNIIINFIIFKNDKMKLINFSIYNI